MPLTTRATLSCRIGGLGQLRLYRIILSHLFPAEVIGSMVDSLVHSSSLLENADLPAVGDWPTLQTALVQTAYLFGFPGKSSKKQPDPLSWSLPENAAHPARMKLLALVAHGAETAGKGQDGQTVSEDTRAEHR